MNFIKMLLAVSSALVLTSCGDKYSGQINMLLDLFVTTDRGVKEVKAGDYQFELTVPSKNRAELKIVGAADDDLKLKFKLTNTTVLPENGNGPIFISGLENSQNFDVVGEMRTTAEEGDRVYWEREQCQYQERYRECFIGADGRRYCRDHIIDRWGWRQIEYTLRHIQERLQASLIIIADGRTAGDLSSSKNYSVRRYRYVGQCF